MFRFLKFGLVAVIGLGLVGFLLSDRRPQPGTPPAAAPQAPDQARAPREGTGQIGASAYTFMTGPDGTVVTFATPLARTDEAMLDAMRHILTTDLGVEGRLTTRVAGEAVRWIAGSGVYDATPVREREGGPVTGLVIQRR